MPILNVKPGSIVDVILLLPSLEVSRKPMRRTEISRAVERRSSEILRDNPLLDRFIEVVTKALRRGLVSGETLRAPRQQLRQLRASAFDLTLDFQGFPNPLALRACLARFVFSASRAILFGSDQPHVAIHVGSDP